LIARQRHQQSINLKSVAIFLPPKRIISKWDKMAHKSPLISPRLFTIMRPVYKSENLGPLKELKTDGNANGIPNGCGAIS